MYKAQRRSLTSRLSLRSIIAILVSSLPNMVMLDVTPQSIAPVSPGGPSACSSVLHIDGTNTTPLENKIDPADLDIRLQSVDRCGEGALRVA